MKKSKKTGTVNRLYKARLFEMIFSNKKELLELYNGINGTHYDNPDELEINTLENAIYMSMRNDISFIIDVRLNLYEHQSTYSPNLPLRYLMYVSDIYSDYTKDMNLYGKKSIKIPTPKFVIFYNGQAEQPDRKELKLSDLFTVEDEDPCLELRAIMLNINKGHNKKLMETCKTLQDYSEYTYRVREYAAELPLEDAVEKAITECIQQGILTDFLKKYRSEAKKMSIYEYDEERHMRQTREEGREEERDGITSLVEKLLNEDRLEDLRRITKDEAYLEKLLDGMGIPDYDAKINKKSIYEYNKEQHTSQTREESWEEGMEAGHEEMAALTERLLNENRLEDLQKMLKDKDYRKKLLSEIK